MSFQKEARLHEKVVQEVARRTLPKVQDQHTSTVATSQRCEPGRGGTRPSTRGEVVAQRVSIQLVDDLDGTDADETVTFGLDGTTYEIDLSEQNAKELRTVLEVFVTSARKVSGVRRKKGSTGDSKVVREWARGQGFTLSNRGVIPAEVRKAYDAAH